MHWSFLFRSPGVFLSSKHLLCKNRDEKGVKKLPNTVQMIYSVDVIYYCHLHNLIYHSDAIYLSDLHNLLYRLEYVDYISKSAHCGRSDYY